MSLVELPRHSWGPVDLDESRATELLEAGTVLYLPHLRFELAAGEAPLLSPAYGDGKAKNISYRGPNQRLQGAQGTPDELEALTGMIVRFRTQAEQLIHQLFPTYRGFTRTGFTSYRPFEVETRSTSWRQDDTRLHVDSFPSNPTRGLRLLRVFSNIHPKDTPRVWRIGEPFADYAWRFLPKTRGLWPLEASVLSLLGLTKSRRSPYDHLMGQLHDLGKGDLDYQQKAPQQTVAFPPGSTWVCFSDQVLHAVMAGQFLLEQTFYLKPEHLKSSDQGPLAVLERLTGQTHLARG